LSGEIPQHLVAHLRFLVRRLRRWPPLDNLLAWLANRFTTWRADEFARFTRSARSRRPVATSAALPPPAPPIQSQPAAAIAPATFEMRFLRLQEQGGYEEMWELLAEDAQRSWGSRQAFVEGMRQQAGDFQLLEANVAGVKIVPEWTDGRSHRTYRNVARLLVRYRLRLGWRELALDRQVHLIPAAGGWRTLYYRTD
jgi:hypothetical protein